MLCIYVMKLKKKKKEQVKKQKKEIKSYIQKINT